SRAEVRARTQSLMTVHSRTKATLACCGSLFLLCFNGGARFGCVPVANQNPDGKEEKRLAITRERKEELVATYSELLSKTDGFIIAEYKGLTVAQVGNLRKKLGDVGGSFSVTKNTLFKIALQENGWVIPDDLLLGPNGVVFGNGNLPAVAKAVQTFSKDLPDIFKVKGGVIANSIFNAKELEAVANLPTMDEIRAQLAGIIVAPASQLAGLLEAATSQVVNVLQAYVDKNEAA
ncbi:MAG: 50S ribosomal protein L10, partial [Chloroflexi bacterium OLB15]